MSLFAAVAIACGGARKPPPADVAEPPPTAAERLLAMLPQGAQVVVELDLARLRTNPVVGEVVTRALAARVADLPAGVPASPLAAADQVVLGAYGVGTAQAATLTLLGAPHDIAGTTRLADGVFAVGPPDWVEQAQQRIALASTGERKLAISAPAELLELRRRAMPAKAPGASLRVTARLPFDARVALARQTGLDAAPAQLSAWADVVDDFALIVDCDAADPGGGDAPHPSDAPRRLEATLRGALAAVSEQPLVRALGLPSSLAGARFVARGSWVRTIIAIGPSHLQRVVQRAAVLLRDADREQADPSSSSEQPSSAQPSSAQPSSELPSSAQPSSALPSSALPSSALPSSAQPSSAQPSSAQPSSAQPSSALPSSALPSSALPSSALPSSALPSSALPSSAQPSSALPSSARAAGRASPSSARPAGSASSGSASSAAVPRGDHVS